MFLYGAGGHGKVIAEIAEDVNVKIDAFIDIDISKRQLLDYDILHEIPNKNVELIISIGNNKIRKKIAANYKNLNFKKLIHSKAVISKRVKIEEGTVVMAGATINSEVKIGKHCIVNTNASIDHDCVLEDFTHISPNAALAGGVFVGLGTNIGMGASVIEGITIGKWCTVGAGSVVIRDIPDGATVVGNPGKIIKITSFNNIAV